MMADKPQLTDKLKQDVHDYLMTFLTDERRDKIDKVASLRTRYITVVLEDISNSHNVSAVIRSCECLGVQDLHVIDNTQQFEVNPCVTQGSSDWVDVIRYDRPDSPNTDVCLDRLEAQGYSLISTTLQSPDVELTDVPIDMKIALLFGNEENGLSETALRRSCMRMRIPMQGFTQSFNISVSTAISLHHLTSLLRKSSVRWQLTDAELLDLKYRWSKCAVNKGDVIERRYLLDRGIIKPE
jgi:tRNA (guanosine-2'-O-)-methyltransferase